MRQYYILYTFPNQKKVHVMHGVDDKVITAEEGNQHLLLDIALKLADEGLFDKVQLVATESDVMAGYPHYKNRVDTLV